MCRICVKLKQVVDSSSKCLEINFYLLIIKIQGFQRKNLSHDIGNWKKFAHFLFGGMEFQTHHYQKVDIESIDYSTFDMLFNRIILAAYIRKSHWT